MSTIVFRNDDILIADKPHGIPTVPLKSQPIEGTLLGLASSECPEILSVKGRNEWEFGALHRLDTATSGLVVFARDQRFYDYLADVQAKGLFSKTYMAETEVSDRLVTKDSPSLEDGAEGSIMSYFRSYGPGSKQVRPIRDIKRSDNSVEYSTLAKRDGDVFTCTISKGFRHQIRAHLAWIGHPISGDVLYGNGKDGDTLELDCFSVSFPLPDGGLFTFSR